MSELVRLRGKIYFTKCILCTGADGVSSKVAFFQSCGENTHDPLQEERGLDSQNGNCQLMRLRVNLKDAGANCSQNTRSN